MSAVVSDPVSYFGQWLPQRSDQLKALEAQARKEQIPIVGPVVGKLLFILGALAGPGTMLELGTAIGYSTLYLGSACKQTGGRLITLEHDPAMAERARINIARAGLEQWVEVRCQEALASLKSITNPLALIFMDIEKTDYIRALPHCKQLLKTKGLLAVDNTGFRDADAFNRAIFADPQWSMVNLWGLFPGHSPEQDGFCLALKQAQA